MNNARLQYFYAGLNSNLMCDSVITTSYVINDPYWVQIPVFTSDYKGKYYNREDGLFYCEPECVNVFSPTV